ncbi:MAG: hypothetical protein JWQ08_2747, partial [Deinococcus sp.]|nr:hypothetical protein [Deinococcus sp.]
MSQTPAELARRLRALTARRAGLAVCLWGEPGIGKTFCVQALLRETPCRSQSLPARLPLTALARSLPRPSRLPVWAEQVLEQLHHGELVDDLRTLNAVAAVLAGLAPFVLHLEDLHEAGPHEQKQAVALARLVARMRGVGWLATSRTPPPEGTEGLQLLPLDADASGALLETEAGTALPEPALAWISQRAAGNPLFTLEYFRLLARQGHLWNNAQRWHWRPPLPDLMPLTVEAMIEQVLMTAARLPIQQRALEARALLGPDISPGIRDSGADGALWARVAALSAGELAEARAALEGLRILAGHAFSHPLYREVALRRLSAPERRRLARRALEALHAEPRKAAAFVESADLDPAEALRWFEQAAQEAGAGPQGARFLARAVPYAQGEHRAALAQEAAQHLRDFDAPEALRLAELAVAAAPADPAPSFLLAELLAGQGRLQEAELLLNTLPETGRTDTARLSRLIRLRASARDTAGVLKLWSRLSELHADPEPEVASAVAFALSVHGQPSAASALASRLLTRPDLDSAPSCELINVLGTSCYAVNDFVGAVEHHSRAVVQAQAAGLTRLEALFLSNRALALGELGRHRERMQDLEASLQLHAASGQMLQVSRTQVAVADACLDLAQYERAEELLLECRAALSRLPPSDHLIECEYRLSVLYRNWAPPHGGLLSLKHAHAALTYAQQTENPRKLAWSLAYASIAESCFGSSGQGLALATQALAFSGSLQAPGQLGMARFA